jgi:hypothetical protein
MPTGSRESDVLLDWILESMGLVRRRQDNASEGEGALHRIMRQTILAEPLKGWTSREIGEETGLSNTGIHHQMIKLRECGLISTKIDGKWHRNVLRGGSISAAAGLIQVQARQILEIRLSELDGLIDDSESRTIIGSTEDSPPFSIRISEPGPREAGSDSTSHLVEDLGFAGENRRNGSDLARDLFVELCSCHEPITLLAISERLSTSRGRVNTIVKRMRSAGILERVPMLSRIPQDILVSLTRQFDARGEDWLISKGGLGRLEEAVSNRLLMGAKQGSLGIESVKSILSPVPIADQSVLLNTLGGRMPLGIRLSGRDSKEVRNSVIRGAERTLRRILTVANRLDDSLD